MTVTEVEREMQAPMEPEEKERYIIHRQKVAQKILQMGELTVEEYARIQAVGMVDHLQQFLRGSEDSFRKYFLVMDSFHKEMHDAFWEETELRFPIRQEISLEEGLDAKFIEFIEYGAGLSVHKQYDANGDLFGISYEGYTTPNTRTEWSKVSQETIGQLATGLAMG
jgi:hypothetical protein